MADPELFDADPDPTFQANAEPDPYPTFLKLEEKKKCLPNLHFFLLHILTKIVMCSFLSNNAGGVARGEG